MKLAGERIILRPLAVDDLPQMALWNCDVELQSYVDCNLPDDLYELEQWYKENVPDRHYKIFSMITKSGRLIGDLELDHICWCTHEAELRIRIGAKEFWGQGYGSEAVKMILDHMLVERKFHRIYLRVYQFNQRAIRCYIKNGFKQIGLLERNRTAWKNIILMEVDSARYARIIHHSLAG